MEDTFSWWVGESQALGDQAAFEAKYPHPFLIIYDPLVEESSAIATGKFSAARLFKDTPRLPKVDATVRRVSKGSKVGNVTAAMITLGRAANNDIVLRDDQVSNFHAYFTQSAGGWHISDAESSNGTRVEGTAIGRATALGEDTPTAFGTIRCRFLSSAEFYLLLAERAVGSS